MARPASTALDEARMREQLARGALALFREGGIDAVSLRKLAGHLGVSHTMLYRYFDSKEALFTAVRLASLDLLYEQLCRADVPSAPPLERVRAVSQALIRFGLEYAREYRFLFSAEQPRMEQQPELLALRHRVFDHIVDIAKAAKQGQLIAMDPRTWVHLAWSMLHGLLTLHESNQLLEGRRFEDLIDAALEVLLSANAELSTHGIKRSAGTKR
jgi:AcrR family transcriptional regulator